MKTITVDELMSMLSKMNKLYTNKYLVDFKDGGNVWKIYYCDKHVININKSLFNTEDLYKIGWLDDTTEDDYNLQVVSYDEDGNEVIQESSDNDFRTSRRMKHDRQIKSIKREKKFSKRLQNDFDDEYDEKLGDIFDDKYDDMFNYMK